MKHQILLALLLTSCGKASKTTENFTSIQCSTTVFNNAELEQALAELEEDEEAIVTEITEPEDFSGKTVIAYETTAEQCNNNGHISDNDGNANGDHTTENQR